MGVLTLINRDIKGLLLADIETTVFEKEMEIEVEDILKSMTKAERKAFNLGRSFQENIDVTVYQAYLDQKNTNNI
jgi:hypothetical protein